VATLRDVVFDCHRPASLARFWASALDGYEVAPYDEAELARLRRIGIDDPEHDPTVLVRPRAARSPATPGPRLWFQQVPEGKATKNRVHLDLACEPDAVSTELARLESLGATRAVEQLNPDVVVMHDPEGNEFCLLR
jgi:hypothetical protein